MYSILEGEGIEIPRYAVLDRDSPDPKREWHGGTVSFHPTFNLKEFL